MKDCGEMKKERKKKKRERDLLVVSLLSVSLLLTLVVINEKHCIEFMNADFSFFKNCHETKVTQFLIKYW